MDSLAREIEELYRARYTAFRKGMVGLTGSYESARDVVQEAFACALRDRKQYRGEGSLAAWGCGGSPFGSRSSRGVTAASSSASTSSSRKRRSRPASIRLGRGRSANDVIRKRGDRRGARA